MKKCQLNDLKNSFHSKNSVRSVFFPLYIWWPPLLWRLDQITLYFSHSLPKWLVTFGLVLSFFGFSIWFLSITYVIDFLSLVVVCILSIKFSITHLKINKERARKKIISCFLANFFLCVENACTNCNIFFSFYLNLGEKLLAFAWNDENRKILSISFHKITILIAIPFARFIFSFSFYFFNFCYTNESLCAHFFALHKNYLAMNVRVSMYFVCYCIG